VPRLDEARRQLGVCLACRYCEGYCAVFPALERRAVLLDGDVAMLANLCHDCRACFQACMYAPPHEFGVDVPTLLRDARLRTYAGAAWPAPLGWGLRHPSAAVVAATGLGLGLALLAAAAGGGLAGLLGRHVGPGAFYAIVPYALMLVPALVVSGLAALALAAAFARSWADMGGRRRELLDVRLWLVTTGEALGLRWLGGGGGGCFYPDRERASGMRRALHVLLVGGLVAAFASTVAAAIEQDLLDRLPPYPVLSVPVLLGSLGGIAIVAATSGLLVLKARAGRDSSTALDVAFLAVLDLAAITGMLTLALRDTPALGPALVAHLGVLAALYVTAPYGKLVHAVHRLAALLRDVSERT
jgi:citrate/tricarballylate utilization protein